jgi:hypothetical protein
MVGVKRKQWISGRARLVPRSHLQGTHPDLSRSDLELITLAQRPGLAVKLWRPSRKSSCVRLGRQHPREGQRHPYEAGSRAFIHLALPTKLEVSIMIPTV